MITRNFYDVNENIRSFLLKEMNDIVSYTGYPENSNRLVNMYRTTPLYSSQKCIGIIINDHYSMTLVRNSLLDILDNKKHPLCKFNVFTGNNLVCITFNNINLTGIQLSNPKNNIIQNYTKIVYNYFDSLGIMYEKAIVYKCKYESNKKRVKLINL